MKKADQATKRVNKTLVPPSHSEPEALELREESNESSQDSKAAAPAPIEAASSASEAVIEQSSDEIQKIKQQVQQQLAEGHSVDGLLLMKQFPHYQKLLKPFLLDLAAHGKQVTFRSPSAFAATQAHWTDAPNSPSLIEDSATPNQPTPSFDDDVPSDNMATVNIEQPEVVKKSTAESKVPAYRPTVRPPMAAIEMVFDGALGSQLYPIMNERFVMGRKEGDLVVGHELWMSGRHAEIQRRKIGNGYRWFLMDLNSTNGCFVRTDAVVLTANDELFLGRERYRFFSQTPEVGLMHVTRGNPEKWLFTKPSESFGAAMENPMQCISTDPYLDPVHAILTCANGSWTIRDNHSRNGLWYRIREFELYNGVEFQLGEQRFRFACEQLP